MTEECWVVLTLSEDEAGVEGVYPTRKDAHEAAMRFNAAQAEDGVPWEVVPVVRRASMYGF